MGFPLYDTPCAFRYPFIEVRTYGLVRRVLAIGVKIERKPAKADVN